MSQSIEVVIPVHDVQRPFKRAASSALDQRSELSRLGVELRVTVVLHNLGGAAGDTTAASAAGNEFDGVTWLACDDGVRSPAGPRNLALDESTATFLSFLDSDDYLEPGSLAAWWKAAQPDSASVVIAPLRTPEGSILPAPRIRPSKPAVLDPLKDGLAYRSVPYGLLRRSALTNTGFRYAEGMRTGEDIEATLKLWFRSGPVRYPYGAPAYQQTDDSGAGRVTSSLTNLADELQWLERLLDSVWLQQAALSERRAVALKILRVHGIGALLRRGAPAGAAGAAGLPDDALWNETERSYWADISSRLYAFASGSLPELSRRDAELTQAAAAAADVQSLRTAVERHRSTGRLGDLVPVAPAAILSRDSVLRHYLTERLRARAGVFSRS
ncbi:glycosyltransferase family 2 protein [Arthrobacter sp. NPDC056727]|uniref:glycosyltransferase family 2 protein n=1 Tax=Arthrobacter sp. NPDC056727 TaxID=3345927 RepID=UPI00366C947E